MKTLIYFFTAVISLLFLSPELSLADAPPIQWQKTFGGTESEYRHSVQQTTDGGYIIAGSTWSFGVGSYDVYLIKTDPNGNSQWQKTFGGPDRDLGHSVQQTSDGGYIIVGYTGTYGIGYGDVYLIKTDPNGDSQWQKTFGEEGVCVECGCSVQQTTDAGYIIAGYTDDPVAGDSDVYLIKTDPNGNDVWQKTFGWLDSEYGFSVQQTFDGGFIIVGYIWRDSNSDIYLVKTDPNGNSQWIKIFEWVNADAGYSVKQASDGGYIITGYTNSFGSGYFDVCLLKTDSNGIYEWHNTFGGSEIDIGYSIRQTSDGGYVITGFAGGVGPSPIRGGDVYLIKTDPNGNSQWQKTFGGTGTDRAYSAQQTADGGYVIAGDTSSYGAGASDVYLIKLCPDGTLSADFNCNGTVYYEDLAILVDEWLQPPVMLFTDIFPEFSDGIVNGFDFAAFANEWLQTTIP